MNRSGDPKDAALQMVRLSFVDLSDQYRPANCPLPRDTGQNRKYSATLKPDTLPGQDAATTMSEHLCDPRCRPERA
jgi:hypothetical protein